MKNPRRGADFIVYVKAVKCLIYLIGRRTICIVQYERDYLVCSVQMR